MRTETTTAKNAETTTAKNVIPTRKGYKIPKGEQNTVAVMIRTRGFDPVTGKPIENPHPYKTDIGFWNNTFLNNVANQGKEVVEILHLPKSAKNPND